MEHFKHIISGYNLSNISSNELLGAISCFHPIFDHIENKDKAIFWKAMKDFHEYVRGAHFDEMYAKYQVSTMHHTKHGGSICTGEVYTMENAKLIYEKHVRNSGSSYNCYDVYVAINAQYHDYSNLYMTWHENLTHEQLDEKIINSAIVFWFKDEDSGEGKVWNYFKNIG